MEIPIKVENKRELFERYLEFLNPIIHLRVDTEVPVLASFLTLHYNYRDYAEDTLNSLLFSKETKEGIRRKLNYSEKSFNKSFKRLEEKGLIKDNKLNPIITKYPKDGKFKLNITFIEK